MPVSDIQVVAEQAVPPMRTLGETSNDPIFAPMTVTYVFPVEGPFPGDTLARLTKSYDTAAVLVWTIPSAVMTMLCEERNPRGTPRVIDVSESHEVEGHAVCPMRARIDESYHPKAPPVTLMTEVPARGTLCAESATALS